MIDSNHLDEANNVAIKKVLDNKKELINWAKTSTLTDNHIWIQYFF
jgi:hypothetical protein